jgi:hypothetical protein
MEFNKCPECGEIDVRRTRCSCGYGADAVTKDPPPPKATSWAEPETKADALPEPGPMSLPEESGAKERLLGVLMLLCGGVLGYYSVYAPLAGSARNETQVSLSFKGAIICPAALVMGLILLVMGKKTQEVFGSREHPSPFAWAFGVILVLIGIGLYFCIKVTLENRGYHFDR